MPVIGTPITPSTPAGIYADDAKLNSFYGLDDITAYSDLQNTGTRDTARIQETLDDADDWINLAFLRVGRTVPIASTEKDFRTLRRIAAEWTGATLAMSRGGMPENAGFSGQDEFEKVMGWHIKHAMDELAMLVADWENTQDDNTISQAGEFSFVPLVRSIVDADDENSD